MNSINNNANTPADGAGSFSNEERVFNPNVPEKGSEYADVMLGIANGYTMLDIEAVAKKKGLSLKMYDNPEKYAENFKNLSPEKLAELHSQVSQQFGEYQKGNFDKMASNIGIIPEYEVMRSMGGFTYSTPMMSESTKTGILTSYGFSQFVTPEGVAQLNDIVVDKHGQVMSIKKARENGMALVLREGMNRAGVPDYYLEAKDWDDDLRKDELFSFFGASSLKQTNLLVSLGKGAWSATVPALLNSIGYLVDKPVDLYEYITDGKVGTDGETDKIGNRFSNLSRSMVSRNEDEKQGAFESWNSFMYAFGDGVTQLATMRGLAGVGFYGLSSLGTNALRAQKVGSAMGMGHAAANMAATMDQVMAEIGYSEEVRAGLFIPLMGTVFAAEKLIGTNNITKFLQSEQKVLAKELKEMGFQTAKQTGKKISDVEAATLRSKMMDIVLNSGKRLNEYAKTHGGVIAGAAAGAREEGLEEGMEAIIEFGIKKIGDWWMKEVAYKTIEHYTGAHFDHKNSTIRYLDGSVERLDEDEFAAAYKDFEQAKALRDRGEGMFNETLSDLASSMKESVGMGAIVGGAAVPMMNRAAYKNNKEKNKVLYSNSIKMAVDPKHESTVKGWIKEMVDGGQFGRTDVDVNGNKISESGEKSQAEVYAESFFNELKANAEFAKQHGINDAAVLRANAGGINMLVPLLEAVKKKESLNQALASLKEQNLAEDVKTQKEAEIKAKIEKLDTTIQSYKNPENNTFSKAYNDRTKELHTSHALTENAIAEIYNASLSQGARRIYSELTEKKKQRNALQKQYDLIAKAGNVDALNKQERKQFDEIKNKIEKADKEIGSLEKKFASAQKEVEANFEKMKAKDEYWQHYIQLSSNHEAYTQYRGFIENGDLDKLIETVNALRKETSDAVESRSTDAKPHLDSLSDAATKLTSMDEWKTGKGFHLNPEIKGLFGQINNALSSLDRLGVQHGVNQNVKALIEGLNQKLGDGFFNRLQEIMSGMDALPMTEYGMDYGGFGNLNVGQLKETFSKGLDQIKARRIQLQNEVTQANARREYLTQNRTDENAGEVDLELEQINARLSEIETEGNDLNQQESFLSNEDTVSAAQSIIENAQSDEDLADDVMRSIMEDEGAQSKFAKSEGAWIDGAVKANRNLQTGLNKDEANLNPLTRESLNNASIQDWLEIYLQDIENSITEFENMENVADPASVEKDINKLIEKIDARVKHILVQGVSLNKLNQDKVKKDHLTANVDYAMSLDDAQNLYNMMMNYKEINAVRIKNKMQELAGSRSIYQVKANAKHLEFQRLSLVHIMEQIGSELGKPFQDAVNAIKPINWDGKTADEIQASIQENEAAILAARELLFEQKKMLFEKKLLNKIFANNDRFLFLNGAPLAYSALMDQSSLDFIEDDFKPAKKIVDNKKVGYVYILSFLEETLSVSPTAMYDAERKILKSQEGSDSKVASSEQIMAVRQLVAFMNNGKSIIGSSIFDAILDVYKEEPQYEAVKKMNAEFMHASAFLRGNAGVGKTNVMLPIAIQMYMQLTGKKTVKLKLVDPTNDLRQRIAELNKSLPDGSSVAYEIVDRKMALTNKLSDDHDFLVWDEASLLKNKHLDHLQENGNKKPIIFLGDESQMQSLDEVMPYSPASKRALRTTPVTMSYRTNVFQIFQLREAFKAVILKPDLPVKYPKMYMETHGDVRWGGQYYSSVGKIKDAFLESKNSDKALVFLTNQDVSDFYEANKASWSKYEGHVYALESLLDTDPLVINNHTIESIQGKGVGEVYLHVDFENISGRNKTLRGRAGLTGVTRGKSFVALVGDENLNTTRKDEVSWNESAMKGKTDAELKKEFEELNKTRNERAAYLDRILDGKEISQVEPEENPEPSESVLDYLRRIAWKSLGGLELSQIDKSVIADYQEHYDKIYAKEKEEREKRKKKQDPEPEPKQQKKSSPVLVSLGFVNVVMKRNVNKVPSDVVLFIGDTVIDSNGDKVEIEGITQKGKTIKVKVAGKEYTLNQFQKKFMLPELQVESVIEGKMHNLSALNYANFGALWTSTGSVPVPAKSNLNEEQIEAIRAARNEFIGNNPGLEFQLVYYKSKSLWVDKGKAARNFEHVMMVEVKGDIKALIKKAIAGSALRKAIDATSEQTVIDALTAVGTFGEIQTDYFTSGHPQGTLSSNVINDLKSKITSGFIKGSDTDLNRAENIDFNLAKLDLLKMAFNNGKDRVVLGDMSLDDSLTVDNHVTYDFKGVGQTFDDFKEAESKKGIEFDRTPGTTEIKGKNGKIYKAYTFKFKRKGARNFNGEVIITMPNFGQAKANGLNMAAFIDLMNADKTMLERLLKNDDFLKVLNNTSLMRLLYSNKNTIESLLNNPKSKIGDYLVLNDGFIDFVGKNDKEKIESIKGFIGAINDFFNHAAGADNTLGELWVPFDQRLASDIRTKAKFISQPQLSFKPEFSIVSDDTDSDSNALDEEISEDIEGGLFRTEQTETRNEGFLTEAQALELIEQLLGEDYAKGAVEFSNDLGKVGVLRILGMVSNGKMRLLLEQKGIKIKTPKHEVFHTVFNYMLGDAKKKELLDYAKNKIALEKNTSVDKVTDLQAEEWMADRYGFTSLKAVKKGKRTVFDRFIDWVGNIGHKIGVFKNEMDYLFWQIDRGQFRNMPVDFSKELERFSTEDFDESETDSEKKERKKYNMSFLIKRFGDAATVERASNFLGTQVIHLSPLGTGSNKTSSFEDAILLLRDKYKRKIESGEISGDTVLTSIGKKISDVTPKEILQILNDSPKDGVEVLHYLLSMDNVFEALLEQTFPGIDLDSYQIIRQGEDTISDDKSLQDFRKKTNNYVRFVLKRTFLYDYKKVGNNYVKVSEQRLGVVDFEDLQYSIIQAALAANRNTAESKHGIAEVLKFELMNAAEKAGVDSKRGRQILSFVDSFFGLNSNSNSIVSKMVQAHKDGNYKKEAFISEFLNAFAATYMSLREKSAIDFKVFGYDNNNLSIKRVEFAGSNETKFKNELKRSVSSKTTDSRTGQVKENTIKNLEKKFIITEDGIKRKDGTYIIRKVGSQTGIKTKYVFTDDSNIKSDVKILMHALGLSNLRDSAFNFIMREETKQDTSKQHFNSLIKDKLDNMAEQYNLREFFADNIAKMIISVKQNQSFFDNVANEMKALESKLPKDFEGSVLDYFDVKQSDIYKKAAKESFGYDTLNAWLRNVDDSGIDDELDFDGEQDTKVPYRVFKPSDFYKFFEVLGAVNDFSAGSGGVSFFYRPDSKKEYLYGLSSSVFDRFSNGVANLWRKIEQSPARGSLLYGILPDGTIKSNNMLLHPGEQGDITLESLKEIKGISQGNFKRGTTKPNTGNYLTIGLNEFLSSMASGESVKRASFLTTNLADSGYMYVASYKFAPSQSFLFNVKGDDFSHARLNDASINKSLASVYRSIKREYDISNNKWNIVFGTAMPTEGFENLPFNFFGGKVGWEKNADTKTRHKQINQSIQTLKPEDYKRFETAILASDMVENMDYQWGQRADGTQVLQLGKATMGLPGVAHYNIDDAMRFLQAYDSGNTDAANNIRRSIFKKAFKNFAYQLTTHKAKVSKTYLLPGMKSGKFEAFVNGEDVKSDTGGDWNPVLEAYFMGYHVTNASLNALWLGSFSQYAGVSTTDISKRSKPFTTPGTSAGNINIKENPHGMDTTIKVAIVTDSVIRGDNYQEGVYKDEVVATDGIGHTNPLAYRHIRNSFGGRFGPLGVGMIKPITSYVDPATGIAIQMKQAEHVLTYDVYSNSLVARRQMMEYLSITDPALPKIFMDEYNASGKGKAGWDAAMDKADQFIIENNLQSKLVWQFISQSAVKTGARRINQYNIETGFSDPGNIQTLDIDTSEIRNVLDPYQDYNDNERMAPPTQMLAIMGIGKQNHERITTVNNALAESFRKGVAPVLNKLFKDGQTEMRKFMMLAIDSMSSMGNFAELVSNPKISLNLPMLSEKAQQIVANNVTKNGQKQKYGGLRANQAPGIIFDVYEDRNGNIYTLSELERNGVATVDENFSLELKDGYTKRKLHPMTNNKAAEVLVPFVYMKKFGVRSTDSLNDLYTIRLKNGDSMHFKKGDKVNLVKMHEYISQNYDSIDHEGSAVIRALTEWVQNRPIEEGTEEAESTSISSLGDIMAQNDKLMSLYNSMKDKDADSEIDMKQAILSKLGDYYNALDASLDMLGVRIPTSNLGSGFRGRVVGFINDNGNTVYTSELKNLLDGSDYDIDQLSLFMRHINKDFTLPEATSIRGLQNKIVETLMDVYSDLKNNPDVYVKLSLKKLRKLADEIEGKAQRYINDPGSAAEDYSTNMQGGDSIDRFANLSSAFSYLNHLSESQIKRILPWVHESIFSNRTGEDSSIFSIGTYLNAATDNAKELILGRLGISKDATNVVGAMIVSGQTQEQIANFFSQWHIRRVYMNAETGDGVEYSKAEHDPYFLTVERLNILKKKGVETFDLNAISSEYFALYNEIKKEVQSPKYNGREDVYSESSPDAAEKIAKRDELHDQKTAHEEYLLLTKLQEYLEKGEVLRRISHMVTLRKGFKAVSSDFEYYKNNLEEYLGMTIHDFADGKKWTPEKHRDFFVRHNNTARFGDPTRMKLVSQLEDKILGYGFNLVEIARSLPQFEQYIKVLSQLDRFYEKNLLIHNKVFKSWGKEFLLGQERTQWLNKAQRKQFETELGKFFIAMHLKNNYKGRLFNIALGDHGIRIGTTLDKIDISTPEGRTMFALQFPQFIMALKNVKDSRLLNLGDNADYSKWFDALRGNEFIERMIISGNNEERGFLALSDNFNLSPDNLYRLKSEYSKLPSELQEMFEIYDLIVNGFNSPTGSIKDVMGISFLEGISKTLDDIEIMAKDSKHEMNVYKESFLKALAHVEGMTTYMSAKDLNMGKRRETILMANPNGSRDGFAGKVLGRLSNRKRGEYTVEYLRTSQLGIPYDPGVDVTTTFEPIHGFTAAEIDTLMIGGQIKKQFNHGHFYNKYVKNENDELVRKYYILPNGKYVIVANSDKYSVSFSFTDESPAYQEKVIEKAKPNLGLEEKGENRFAYQGALDVQVIEKGNDENKVFLIGQPLVGAKSTRSKINKYLSMENTLPITFTNVNHKSHDVRFLSDAPNGKVNEKFKEVVDAQIEAIKEAIASGKQIVFPKYGAGSNEMILARQKAPVSMEYLESRFKDELGIVFDTYNPKKASKEQMEYVNLAVDQMQQELNDSGFEVDLGTEIDSDLYSQIMQERMDDQIACFDF